MSRPAISACSRSWDTRRAVPIFRFEEKEVAELIEAPLEKLLDPASAHEEDWDIRGGTWRIPFYQFGPHKVWGATAMILAEFVAMFT